MRGYLYMAMFALVVAAPFLVRRAMAPPPPPDAAAARLVVVTPHSIDICREFAKAFDRWHRQHYKTGATLEFRRPGGTNDIARLLQTTYLARSKSDRYVEPEIDVAWGGGDYFFNTQLQPPPSQRIAPAPLRATPWLVAGALLWALLVGWQLLMRRWRAPAGLIVILALIGLALMVTPALRSAAAAPAQGDYRILQPLGLESDPALKRTFDACFPQPALAGINLYERRVDARHRPLPCQWAGVCLSSFGIVYNADVYRRLELPPPKTWIDLASPRLAGWLALADPTHSGSAAVAYEMVVQRAMADSETAYFQKHPTTQPAQAQRDPAYQAAIADGWHRGMGQLVAMAANARYFTNGAPEVPNDVGNGQAAAGVAIDFYGWTNEQTLGVHRCRFVLPQAATAITPDPVAILADVRGARLELARQFVEFLLSPQGQRLWDLKPGEPGGPEGRSLRRMPIRRDVYADRTGWADDIDPFSSAGAFNERPQWMALFGQTLPIWGAAWIDSRDALTDAWKQISVVTDPTQRAALRAQLCDLPIIMEDLRRQRDAERTMTTDLEVWRARQRMQWARRFRAHYSAVGDKARQITAAEARRESAAR